MRADTDNVDAEPADNLFRFTDARLRALRPNGRQQWFRDTDAPLKLMLSAAGAKSWYVERRVNGKPRRVRLAACDDMLLTEARRVARVEAGKMAGGVDPTREREQRRQQAEAAEYRVSNAVDDYITDAEKGIGRRRPIKPKTAKGYRHVREKYLAPLAKLPLTDLGGRELDKLRRDNTAANANSAIRLLRAACNHAADRDMIAASPFAGRRRQVVALPPRDRYLPPEELGRFLRALADLQATGDPLADDAPRVGEQVGGDALLLMVLYGLRSTETRSLPWSAVDLKAGTLMILDTKNHATLTLPITGEARALLNRRRKLASMLDSPFVFPTYSNRRSGTGYLAEPRHALDAVEAATKIAVTPHDLRRTFVSLAGRHLPYAMLKAVVNHAAQDKGDVTLTSYFRVGPDEMREPLEALHAAMAGFRSDAGKK